MGRVALVTGGGSGIGEAAALLFAREGYRVAIAGRRKDELERVAERIQAEGGSALAIPADVTREADVKRMVAAPLDAWGRLDAAFNNAGIEGAFGPVAGLSEADFDTTIAVNLKGVWLSCKHEMSAMAQAGTGAIVNTASWLARGAFPGSSIYSASKAALAGMIRALALEGPVRVNNVDPGIIDTPMFRRFADDASAHPFIQHTPARRLGTPEEVAEVAVWLCSDAARFVNGQSIVVDGGYTIAGHRTWLGGEVAPR